MPPFLNFLGRKPGTNSGEAALHSDTRISEDSHRSTPFSIRKSQETEPPEYKLSGMYWYLLCDKTIQLTTD